MLENIFIKNVALIKKENVDLKEGLNIISGETGSGKSMFIDAINFMLGGKISKDFVRHGEDFAEVVGTFSIENKKALEELINLEVEIEDDLKVQIKRVVNENGKSSVKINGKVSTIGMVKSIASVLVDVHLQHEHQALLSQNKHIDFLDVFCGKKIELLKNEIQSKFKDFKEIEKEIFLIETNQKEKNIKMDMFNIQINEIESVSLKENEEENLIIRRKILGSAEKIKNNSEKILTELYDCEEEDSAYDKITKAIYSIEIIVNSDESQKYILESLLDIQANIEDISLDIRSYSSNLQVEPNELNLIEERLSIISKLKKKYGNSVSEIIEYLNKIKNELNLLENSEQNIEKLKHKKENLLNECLKICEEITLTRKSFKDNVTKNIVGTLQDLGMKDVKFDILFEKKKNFDVNGIDEVSFLISTNKGQGLKPLDKIASGGEMSRIMIAIKNLISESYNIETFIFDEIDSGVSGRTAQKVGEKLWGIGKHHQIICITHLPQIASIGDNHLMIFKESKGDETQTFIKKLDENDEVLEIARLIGGAKITDATIEAAREMKSMATQLKT